MDSVLAGQVAQTESEKKVDLKLFDVGRKVLAQGLLDVSKNPMCSR